MFSFTKRTKRSKVTFIQVEPSDTTIVINKQLQSILKPINILHTFLSSNKYKIRDNVITPNSFRDCFLSLIPVLIIISCSIYSLKLTYTTFPSGTLNLVIRTSYTISVVSDGIVSCLNYLANVKNRQNNVLLISKLLNPGMLFKINGKKHLIINWASIVTVICFYILFDLYFWYSIEGLNVVDIIITTYFITFDLNLIYVTRLLNLLSCYLESWIQDVKSFGYTAEVDNEIYWIKMFDVFSDVLEAYKLIQKTFEKLVST